MHCNICNMVLCCKEKRGIIRAVTAPAYCSPTSPPPFVHAWPRCCLAGDAASLRWTPRSRALTLISPKPVTFHLLHLLCSTAVVGLFLYIVKIPRPHSITTQLLVRIALPRRGTSTEFPCCNPRRLRQPRDPFLSRRLCHVRRGHLDVAGPLHCISLHPRKCFEFLMLPRCSPAPCFRLYLTGSTGTVTCYRVQAAAPTPIISEASSP